MFSLIASITVLAVVGPSAEIVLFKCCSGADESYDAGNNKCVEDEQILQKKWPPSVYSLEGKRKVPWKNNNFNITHNLVNCEGDTVVQSSSDVTLFEDGTLKVRKMTSKLDPGTFCIERAVQSKGNFAARFCLPDVCKTKMCVRKCCPVGYSFDEQSCEDQRCEPSGKEFSLEFKNETGDILDLPATSLGIRSAVLPNCPDGFLLLDPSTYPEDEFFILPSGQLFVPSYKANPVLDEYCIEDILVANNESGDEEYQRKALICSVVSSKMSDGEMLVVDICIYLQFVASFFLLATVAVYVLIPEMQNIHGVNVMCHCVSLATTFITFGIIKLNDDFDTTSCIIAAIVTHFAFLSSFTWLTVLSFDIWRSLTDLRPRSSRHNFRRRIRHRFPYYSAFAWGIPFIIVSIGQLLTYIPGIPEDVVRPKFGTLNCWFPEDDYVILVYLYGPIGTLLVANVIFFTLTAIRLGCTRTETALRNKHNRKKKNSIITFSIFLLMGMTWVTEIITWATGASPYYSAATDILNILTGVFIFIIFVCKKDVIEKILKKLHLVTSFIQRTASTWTLSATRETKLASNELSKDSTVYSSSTNKTVD